MEIWNELAKLGIVFVLMGFGMVMEWREIVRLRLLLAQKSERYNIMLEKKDNKIEDLNNKILAQEKSNTEAYKESNGEYLEAISDVTDAMKNINHTLITGYAKSSKNQD